jgi:lipopolysaccharide export system permease protein
MLARMGSIGRYIFRSTFAAFVIVLGSLTMAIWLTQAMREFDLMTNMGQTVLAFIGITSLVIPALTMIIAPIALVVAVAHILNKLNSDSEIIVLNAAGVSPWHVLRPLLSVAIVVSIMVAVIGAYVSPKCLRDLRQWAAEIRADIFTNIMQPGRFTTVEGGLLTFHIRDRQPNGLVLGIFVDDRRNAKEHASYLAEQGEIVKNENGAFLVLENGSIQRQESGQRDPRIVTFDRYAFDLSKFTGGSQKVVYSVREKFLSELIWPDPNDPTYQTRAEQYRSEISDRIVSAVYPLVFVLIIYAFIGNPQTTRQSRALSLAGAIGCVALLRLFGFVSTLAAAFAPWMIALNCVVLAAATALAVVAISRGAAIEPPAFLTNSIAALTNRFASRFGTTG